MGIKKEITNITCNACGNLKLRTSLKSPYLDDFLVSCANIECGEYVDAISNLRSMDYACGKQEHKRDEYFREQLGDGREDDE